MKDQRFLWMLLGLALGAVGTALYMGSSRPALAAGNDRSEDYILCTGPAAVGTAHMDGVWLLDYRAGKLLGTVIDRLQGKIISWAEVDLTQEFNIAPKQNVHFLMTTGTITQGQAALYVAETASGKFAVYSMGPRNDGRPGILIRRHDLTAFRAQP